MKLFGKGMTEAQIAQKIGYFGPNIETGIQRVRDAIKRHSPPKPDIKAQFGVEDIPKRSEFLGEGV